MLETTKNELRTILESPDLPDYKNEAEALVNELNSDPVSVLAAVLKRQELHITKKEKLFFKRNPDSQRFFINIGSLEDIDAKDLMKLIMERVEEVVRDDFSDVYVKDKYSFFELPKDKIQSVLDKLNGIKLNDRDVRVELSEKRKK